MATVQHFNKPKKVTARNKLIGINEVKHLVLVRWADPMGNIDDRLALVLQDGKVQLTQKQIKFDAADDELAKQLTQRMKMHEIDPTPKVGSLDLMSKITKKAEATEVKEETDAEASADR